MWIDYFNEIQKKYTMKLSSNKTLVIRLDGKVLISNDFTQKNKLMINDEEIFKTIKEKNSFSDIINFNNEKNIISFTKTLNSPFGVIVRLNYEKSFKNCN